MPSLKIPTPRLEQAAPGRWRLTATIDGHALYFEAGFPLVPSPEVFVPPFLIPAMHQGLDLEPDAPVSPKLAANLDFARRLAAEWWPGLSGGRLHAAVAPVTPAPGRAAALFYTGGVDSSYALCKLHTKIKSIIFVEGFDVPLSDEPRLAKIQDMLNATSRACGVMPITIRTNLRDYFWFGPMYWEQTHVSALSAVAHSLQDQFHTVYVAASEVPPPYGSHPDLDAAWSSDSVQITNFGWELSRIGRVKGISRWKPLEGRLRVCWENNEPELNCGYCEKCLRTRLQLLVARRRDGLRSFPLHPLPEALRRLKPVPETLRVQWDELAKRVPDRELRREIVTLLTGCPPPPSRLDRLSSGVLRLVGRRG